MEKETHDVKTYLNILSLVSLKLDVVLRRFLLGAPLNISLRILLLDVCLIIGKYLSFLRFTPTFLRRGSQVILHGTGAGSGLDRPTRLGCLCSLARRAAAIGADDFDAELLFQDMNAVGN